MLIHVYSLRNMKTTRYHSNRDRHGILKPRVFSLGTDFNNYHLDFGNNCAIYYGNYMILLVDSYTCILFSWVVDFVYKADRHNAGAFHGPQIPRCTEGALYVLKITLIIRTAQVPSRNKTIGY